VAVSGSRWQAVAVSGNRWQSVAIRGTRWQAVAVSGHRWQSVAIRGTRWQSVAIGGNPWHPVAIGGTLSDLMKLETKQEQVAQHAHVGARLRLLSRHLELHDAHPMQRKESHRAAQRLRLESLDVNLEHAEWLLQHGVDAHGGDWLPIGERAWRECGDVLDGRLTPWTEQRRHPHVRAHVRGQSRHRAGAPCRAGTRASTRLRLRARDAREWNEHAKVAGLIEHRVAVDGQPFRKACSVEVYCQSDDVLIRSHRLEGDDGAAEREREHRVPAKVRADVHHQAAGRGAALARAIHPYSRQVGLDN